MESKKFATAINCIDGRTQKPLSEWIKNQYDVDYVDMITEPGCDKVVCGTELDTVDKIKSKVLISINAHKSSLIAIAGHHDCAGNPVSIACTSFSTFVHSQLFSCFCENHQQPNCLDCLLCRQILRCHLQVLDYNFFLALLF